MNLSKVVAGGFHTIALGRILTYAAQLVVMMMLARLVAIEAFGVLAICSSIVALGLVLSSMGFGPALVQRATLGQAHRDCAMALTMLLVLVVCALAWVSSSWIVSFFGIAEHLHLYRFVCLCLPLGALSSVGVSLLQRDLRFATIAAIEVGAFILGYGVPAVTLAILGFNEWSLAIAMVGQALTKWLAVQISAQRLCDLRLAGWRFGRRELRDLLSFGVGYSVGELASFFSSQGDYLVVGHGFGQTVVAHYTRAYQVISLPAALIGQALDAVLFPALSRIQRERDRIADVYMVALTCVAIVFMPLSVGLGMTADPIVRIVLGGKWVDAVPIVALLSAFTFFRMAYKLTDPITRALGAVNRSAVLKIVYGVLVVVGAVVGSRWGIAYVCLLVGLAMVVNYILLSWLMFRYIPFRARKFVLAHARGVGLAAISSVVMKLSSDLVWPIVDNPIVRFSASWLLLMMVLGGIVLRYPGAVLGFEASRFVWQLVPLRHKGSRLLSRVERSGRERRAK